MEARSDFITPTAELRQGVAPLTYKQGALELATVEADSPEKAQW